MLLVEERGHCFYDDRKAVVKVTSAETSVHRVTQDECDSQAKKTDNAKASTSWYKSTDIAKTRPPWLMYRKYQSVELAEFATGNIMS